ncbi:MAG: MerR family transcriptional regulator [Rickettsia endosymbiont of Pentastiridius leporinus]
MNTNRYPESPQKVEPKKSSVEKKYYSASEITEALGIALHQLRYLETKIPNLSNYKVRGRRYYTANDRNLFQDHLNINTKLSHTNSSEYINKIDILLTKLNDLSLQIKKNLADTI